MSVFATQPSPAEKMFARYFQNYFEVVMSELNEMTNNDTTKWRSGLKDISSWNDEVMDGELAQFKEICPDADMLHKTFELQDTLRTFLYTIMVAASRAPAIIDRHYWTYPHRDRQAFLVDTISMAARSTTLARRSTQKPPPEPPSMVPKAPPRAAPPTTQTSQKTSSVVTPDESVSQATASVAKPQQHAFSFDVTDEQSQISEHVDNISRSSRFPSQVSRQNRTRNTSQISRGSNNIKEFSIAGERDHFMQSPLLQQPISEDLETGIEY